jgi:hypothetical protein
MPDVRIRPRGHSKDGPDSWEQQLDACIHEARKRGTVARIDVQALSQHSVSMEVLSALLHINRVACDAGLKVAFDNVPKSAADRFAGFNLPEDSPSYLDISSVLIPTRAKAKGEAA